ncbi:pyruvate synthase subunit beta [Brenneria goodwinii]|uniref:thiamine pyrophosphate-dependent enzyme n=1 Tax=Brenneria goodwinii TaxID=1109412 RepID=UPI000EF25879|nr:thiamine pyrophosphate-dependent enzyme [Brenneria goodwinii]MCG8158891.1 pyruvate synthase subunit beta [Brenneria goodwinii]MCG8162494.1 pyruvate synthase subunit beta [Brenneria goodwinii]MCG8166535.1 pyruvate synthase subunit beta [Brenneria goodwinii]MCG8170511.1 pyruvate synthase subunit beta [Brenneria goodwinii]MCG8174489.1 pyruvate synthase subunit beta [Brenneria goodwinii]
MSISIKTLPPEEYFIGHKACAGCGGSLVVRLALKVFGPKSHVVIPAGCMSAVGFIYPQMAVGVNAMIAPFAATGAVLSGLAAALRAKGITDIPVVGFAGDGATADIGLQSLSGAFDRQERIIYICYDNEAYMNTGIQKSGATPWGAKTTTSPTGFKPYRLNVKKDLLQIAAAHHVPYAATASVGQPSDLLKKLEKAASVDGPAFLHVFAPCPTGWGCASDSTIALGKSVVDTGLWPLLEYQQGVLTINRNPNRFAPLESYFSGQDRFKSLDPDLLDALAVARDERWRELRAWADATAQAVCE